MFFFTLCLSHTALAADFTFENLKLALKNAHANTVANGLDVLPKEYLNNFTLIKTGSALQQSSPDAPRAILFGDTGNLVITYNGSPDQVGYDSLETAEFNEQTHRINYLTIAFK